VAVAPRRSAAFIAARISEKRVSAADENLPALRRSVFGRQAILAATLEK